MLRSYKVRSDSFLLIAAMLAIVIASPSSLRAAEEYEIEAAVNDEKFIIDGEKYEAKTYCMGWDEGDTIIFIDGTPGVCVDATLYNKTRREKCDVWCE